MFFASLLIKCFSNSLASQDNVISSIFTNKYIYNRNIKTKIYELKINKRINHYNVLILLFSHTMQLRYGGIYI